MGRDLRGWVMSVERHDFAVVIPARLASTRLPGKPLRPIAGVPMIVRVLRAAERTGAREICVACDDESIAAVVSAAGGRALLTAATHVSGTDRVREVVDRLAWDDQRIVVNLQGDEPSMRAELVREVVALLASEPRTDIATAATPIASRAELWDPNAVKVVLADDRSALYFSRAPIPWSRAHEGAAHGHALRHLGLYAYRVGALRKMTSAPPAPLELVESLEQLRALALGLRIGVHVTHDAPAPGVDTEEDLVRAQRAFAEGADD
jgi:3-deoxy-manno-octulosonate cytidylyltransferase (CMP-KDO synthetase)